MAEVRARVEAQAAPLEAPPDAPAAAPPRPAWADAPPGALGPDAVLPDASRGDWVPLRTLTVLRWVAIAGQTAAIVAATRILGLDIATGAASLAIGASVVANLLATFLAPRTRRLAEREAVALLAFDIVQLGVLLALTGGLTNPFAVLILAPVTIAATVLPPERALRLGALTLAVIAAIGFWHLPIVGPAGPLAPPRLLLVGFGLALAIGVVFVGLYVRRVTAEVAAMGEALAATRMALAREQRLTDLGGVVAAAAHELGTPLATIKLASGELAAELAAELPGRPDLWEDARLIAAQADRCRDILHAMGQQGRRDPFLDRAPALAVLEEAAGPHLRRGKAVEVRAGPGPRPDPSQPDLPRRPEIVHGLRNLVQNAVDFAAARVELSVDWTAERIWVRISDDGPGFSASALGRIGDPFLRRRPSDGGGTGGAMGGAMGGGAPGARPGAPREGHEGMGLGLFIAKTLLERTGARLTFANGPTGGAVVVVTWPRAALAAPGEAAPPRPRAAPGA